MSTIIEPTLGRIVYYRGNDGITRPAIVVGVAGTFTVDLYVFGQDSDDDVSGHMGHVTHADPEQEPGCFPSWHWMPYQKQQAEKQAANLLPASGAAHAGYSTMQPHQQRVVDERAELDDKLMKLNNFIDGTRFSSLDADEQDRLKQQAATMAMYSDILSERIAAF